MRRVQEKGLSSKSLVGILNTFIKLEILNEGMKKGMGAQAKIPLNVQIMSAIVIPGL